MSDEPIFLDLGRHELCRFPSNGKWSLRVKMDDDVAHMRYLDEFEVRMIEAALKAPRSEALRSEAEDAARYRYIRAEACKSFEDEEDSVTPEVMTAWGFLLEGGKDPADMDAAFDAARSPLAEKP